MKLQNSDTKRITEKAFSRLVITSILGIIVCLVCLSTTTWAFFTANTISADNKIRAAKECLLSVTVEKEDHTKILEIDPTSSGEAKTASLNSGSYLVTMTLPEDSASGYLVIEVNDRTYYSPCIFRDDIADPEKNPITFELRVPENVSVTATFEIRWGIYSTAQTSVENEGILIIN